MARERHNVAFLVGVMFGAAGAAVASLLSTPLSGMETRQQLSERVAALRGGDGTPTQGTRTVTPTQGTGTLRTDRVYSTDASDASATTVATGRIYSTAVPEPARTLDGDTTVTTTRINSSDRDDTSEPTRTFGA
jgi:gas vesicle protein